MIQKELADLTDEELMQQAKKIKSTKIFDAGFIGLLIGISVYSSVKNGFGLLSFLPLLYIPIASGNKKRTEALEKELKERNLR